MSLTHTVWPEKRGVADRPHWITIVIGALSPTLGAVALLISWNSLSTSQASLKTSQQAMKLGQQAYLTAAKLSTHVNNGTLAIDYNLDNVGNTPANSVRLSYVLSGTTKADIHVGADLEAEIPASDIGPKSGPMHIHDELNFGEFGLDVTRMFSLIVKAQYSDVFRKTHNPRWCWHVQKGKTTPCRPFESFNESE